MDIEKPSMLYIHCIILTTGKMLHTSFVFLVSLDFGNLVSF